MVQPSASSRRSIRSLVRRRRASTTSCPSRRTLSIPMTASSSVTPCPITGSDGWAAISSRSWSFEGAAVWVRPLRRAQLCASVAVPRVLSLGPHRAPQPGHSCPTPCRPASAAAGRRASGADWGSPVILEGARFPIACRSSMTTAAAAPSTGAMPSPLQRSQGIALRRGLVLMLMTLVVPGSAQLAVGKRLLGRIALRTWLILIGVAVVFAADADPARAALVHDRGLREPAHPHRPALADPCHRPGLEPVAPGRLVARQPAQHVDPRQVGLRRARPCAGRLRRRRRLGGLRDVRRPVEARHHRVHRRRHHPGAGRPVQHPPARRGRRRGPHRDASGLDDGGQHRRRNRQDGAVQPAAQPAARPVPRRLPAAREVPRRLLLPREEPVRGLHAQRRSTPSASRTRSCSPA